jgi:hypothetical protein
MHRWRFGALIGALCTAVVALHFGPLWETPLDFGLRAIEGSGTEELQRLEDDAKLARALVYVDAHAVNPAAVDPERADKHKQWLASVERELARLHVPAAR